MSPELTAALERAKAWHETATEEEKAAMFALQRQSFVRSGIGATDGCGTVYFPAPTTAMPGTSIRDVPVGELAPTDRWWAQRWIDKATPGELAAMRELLA